MEISNRGTGAGGSNTNKNGLSYEDKTSLDNNLDIVSDFAKKKYKIIRFHDSDKEYIQVNQYGLIKYMKQQEKIAQIDGAHGCKKPDECYINEDSKTIIIIEKKFQENSGSACEKIQTPDFKIWQYSQLFPEYNIKYVYCLSDWFKAKCKRELVYLKEKNVPVFWGNDDDYKTQIIDYILSY
jgi:hypothetical protein